MHSDTPSFALALRAALRQAPKVILVGEMRDKETIEIALEAAETGHLVLSTLHTTDASKTVERIIGVFPLAEQQTIRNRFAKSFRYIVSQRLLPRKEGVGRVAAIEILKSTLRTREYLDKGEVEGKSLLDAMRDGDTEGMQHFDGEIEKLIRAGMIDYDTAMAYATNPGNLRLLLSDLLGEAAAAPRHRLQKRRRRRKASRRRRSSSNECNVRVAAERRKECSPGRKPWVQSKRWPSPNGAKEPSASSRPQTNFRMLRCELSHENARVSHHPFAVA